jgi:DNA repair exonuclease SbcCD nuclease subunit
VPLVPALDLDIINVLAFHGMDLGSPQEHRSFAPFTAGEILAAGFDYAALGHYHRAAAVGDAAGVIGAYSGALRGWGRPGNGRYAVLVDVRKESQVSTQYIADPGGFRPNESLTIPLDAGPRHADWPKRAWNRR